MLVLFCYPGGGGGGGGYYYNNNLKCMLILSYIDDSGPDRMIFNLNELFDSVFY